MPSVFPELLETVAPGPDDIVVLVKAYFDESYNDDLLCVAGYLFTSPLARSLDHDWKVMLHRYRLPYFRMSACNANEPPFGHLTEDECIAVATEAIQLINKYAIMGFAVTVDQPAFRRWVTPKEPTSTPYEMCTWHGLIPVRIWCDEHAITGKASFFFESGFKHAGLANRMMNQIFAVPMLREVYRYKSHTFIDKADCRPIQAADLLAWQWYKDRMRRAKGLTKPRGDLAALTDGTVHWTLHLDEEILSDLTITNAAPRSAQQVKRLAELHASVGPIFPKEPGKPCNPAALAYVKNIAGREFR